tara:strand:+ start:72 stop:248 length:177 start_codon:yes stop_codon:yes gene_type:complete
MNLDLALTPKLVMVGLKLELEHQLKLNLVTRISIFIQLLIQKQAKNLHDYFLALTSNA